MMDFDERCSNLDEGEPDQPGGQECQERKSLQRGALQGGDDESPVGGKKAEYRGQNDGKSNVDPPVSYAGVPGRAGGQSGYFGVTAS